MCESINNKVDHKEIRRATIKCTYYKVRCTIFEAIEAAVEYCTKEVY